MHTHFLQHLMQHRALHAVFQPILDLKQGQYLACEALIRGPEGSNLHSPAQLFAAADGEDCSLELEWLAVETAILSFAEQRSALRLFLNIADSHRTDREPIGHRLFRFAGNPAGLPRHWRTNRNG